MTLELQTIALLPVVCFAGFYVARSLYVSVRPKTDCTACPQNRRRSDDYA